MTKKTTNPEKREDKYSVTYEDEFSISIWKYDKKRSVSGPVEIEHKWKKIVDFAGKK
jgi:hypothetical protein